MERQKKHITSPFASPEKMEGVYEDDDIETERCCVHDEGTCCGVDVSRTFSEFRLGDQSDGSRDEDEQIMIAAAQITSMSTQVSPSTSPFATTIDLHPKISISPLHSKKRELPPMDLDDAFMELSLEINPSIVTPGAISTCDNLSTSLTPADDASELSTSLEPVVASRSSSLSSNLNAQLEAVTLNQQHFVTKLDESERLYHSPTKIIRPEKDAQTFTSVCSPDQKITPTHAQQFELTPLSKAIISRRGQFQTSTRARSSPSKSPASTITPKRKPRGVINSSSKRRKREKRESDITTTASTATPRKLYNGSAVERIRNVRKCTDKHCRWDPSLHKLKAACERCWTLASDIERKSFIENGGRHIRINLVKGGCPASCKLFLHHSKRDDEDIRLCRKCFDDMHHVGIRQTSL